MYYERVRSDLQQAERTISMALRSNIDSETEKRALEESLNLVQEAAEKCLPVCRRSCLSGKCPISAGSAGGGEGCVSEGKVKGRGALSFRARPGMAGIYRIGSGPIQSYAGRIESVSL